MTHGHDVQALQQIKDDIITEKGKNTSIIFFTDGGGSDDKCERILTELIHTCNGLSEFDVSSSLVGC